MESAYGKVHPRFCRDRDGRRDDAVREVYRVLPDAKAAAEGYLRMIDESGEDYLYPEKYFFWSTYLAPPGVYWRLRRGSAKPSPDPLSLAA